MDHKPQRTIRLEREADEYLQALIPERTGAGAFVSRLILEYKLLRRLESERPRPVSRQHWEATGLNVDWTQQRPSGEPGRDVEHTRALPSITKR